MLNHSKNTIIKFENVCFGYEPSKQIINNVSFEIHDNEFICIVGANASGKSTLAKIMVGLFKPRSGSIYFQNQLITKSNFQTLKNNIGIIFENPDSQLIGFTPEDDIAFSLENKQVASNKMHDTILEVAKTVGITKLLDVDVSTLSGGQKQKVAIASILACNPKVIIFDEATSMLDAASKNSLIKLMNELKTVYKKTIIWITHDMNDTINADRVMVLNNGSIYGFGKPDFIFNKDIERIGLTKPFALELSSKIKGIKPCINIQGLAKEIKHAK